jgi:hypothetical protein
MNTQSPVIDAENVVTQPAQQQVMPSMSATMSPEQEFMHEAQGRGMMQPPSPQQLAAVAQEYDNAALATEQMAQGFKGRINDIDQQERNLRGRQDELAEQQWGGMKTAGAVVATTAVADQGIKWIDKNIANPKTLVDKGIKTIEDTGQAKGGWDLLNPLNLFEKMDKDRYYVHGVTHQVEENLGKKIGTGDLTDVLVDNTKKAADAARSNNNARIINTIQEQIGYVDELASKGASNQEIAATLDNAVHHIRGASINNIPSRTGGKQLKEVLDNISEGAAQMHNLPEADATVPLEAVKNGMGKAAETLKNWETIDSSKFNIKDTLKTEGITQEILEDVAKNQIKESGTLQLFGKEIKFGEFALGAREKINNLSDKEKAIATAALLTTVAVGTYLGVQHHNNKKQEEIEAINPQIAQKETEKQTWVERTGKAQMYAQESKEAANNIRSMAANNIVSFKRDGFAAGVEERKGQESTALTV